MNAPPLNDDDRDQLRESGIAETEALRQLEMLRSASGHLRLDRPCTLGDGIVTLDETARSSLERRHAEAARKGRCGKFVPASGAATRMFRDLLGPLHRGGTLTRGEVRASAEAGDREARALLDFVDGIRRFAFYDDLRDVLSRRGEDPERLARDGPFAKILTALLTHEGLGYADAPKAFVKFHRYPEGGRTPVEEHLVESTTTARDEAGRCRVHFTVPDAHLAMFRALVDRVRPGNERSRGARFDVTYSVQKPSTDTLALEADGSPARDGSGRLILRPGGHGSLLENLVEIDGDIVFIRNIDNVAPEGRGPTLAWKTILAGHLLQVQGELFDLLGRLRRGPDARVLADALRFARERLNLDFPVQLTEALNGGKWELLRDRLHRPLRVCGVVRNTGEPGGGPFWVRGRDGARTLQIVESAQVDPDDPEQQSLFASSTHFNPVDLVCAVRDDEGRPFDLRAFVDPESSILTRKSVEGRELRVLEHPGLWNGSMAGWNTIFVEAPLETFTPVKTVLDLLRPEHQPSGG